MEALERQEIEKLHSFSMTPWKAIAAVANGNET